MFSLKVNSPEKMPGGWVPLFKMPGGAPFWPYEGLIKCAFFSLPDLPCPSKKAPQTANIMKTNFSELGRADAAWETLWGSLGRSFGRPWKGPWKGPFKGPYKALSSVRPGKGRWKQGSS